MRLLFVTMIKSVRIIIRIKIKNKCAQTLFGLGCHMSRTSPRSWAAQRKLSAHTSNNINHNGQLWSMNREHEPGPRAGQDVHDPYHNHPCVRDPFIRQVPCRMMNVQNTGQRWTSHKTMTATVRFGMASTCQKVPEESKITCGHCPCVRRFSWGLVAASIRKISNCFLKYHDLT